MGTIIVGSTAQATDFYKANNTNNLNTSAAWENLAGTPFAEPTKPTNTSATSDTDIWTWDARVLAANTVLTGGDLRVRTIRITSPGGLVTIDGGSPTNKTITVISGGGIDMSSATQDLTIQNLSTSNLTVGLRISSSGGNMGISVAADRTLTLNSKITASGNSSGTNSTVNFTGPGTMICNAEMMANRLNIASGEVQLNLATGSPRPGTGSTPFTNINGGRLVVNNTTGSATGNGPVNVNSTATLTGQGIMSGLVTVASGATIIPGLNGVGSLNAGSFTMAAGSTMKWESNGTTSDIVNVTNNDGLTINGGTVEIYNEDTTDPFTGIGTFNLFAYTGAIGGSGVASLTAAESTKIAGQTYTFGVSAGFVTLRIGFPLPQSYWNVDADGNWTLASNWTANGVPNAVSAIANLGGAPGVTPTAPRTVTLNAPVTLGVLNFNSPQQFTLAGTNALTFDDLDVAATLKVESGDHLITAPLINTTNGLLADVKNVANTLTVQGDISGNGGLTKAGPGTLILTADNTYGDFNTVTSIGAGVLQLGDGGTTGSIAGPISNSGTLRINLSGSLTLNSPISGTGSVEFTGTGTTTLSVANTFSGPTTIAAGAIEILDTAALQNSTLTYSNTGGDLTYYPGIVALTLGGLSGDKPLPLSYLNTNIDPPEPTAVSLTVGQNNSSTNYSASTTGGGALTKTGTGTLSLSGTHVFSGATTISGGVHSLDAGSDFTTASVSPTAAGAKLLINGGTFTASLASQILNASAGIELVSGTANFNGGITSENNPSNGAFFVNVAGGTLNAASISMSRGNLNLGTTEPAAGSATAGLYIHGGTVSVAGNLNIGNNSTNSTATSRIDSGSLTVNGTTTVNINSPDRWSIFDVAGGTFTSTSATGVVLGGTNAGQVVMHVRGDSPVAKIERAQVGQAAVGGTSILNLSAGSLFVGAGGMVVESTNPAHVARLKLGGGVLGATADSTSTVPVSLTGPATVTGADDLNAPHTATFSGAVDGTGSLTKNGSGSVSFTSPNNAFSGTVTVTSGTLGLAVSVAAGATLIPNGTLNPQAASTVDGTLGIRYDVGNLVVPGRISSQETLTLAAGSSLDISGTGSLTQAAYVIASAASGVTGTFTNVSGVPDGYSLVYNYNNGSGNPVVALVSDSATPYDTWAESFGLSGDNALTNADPDFDGVKNLIEFALGTDPTQSSAGPVVGRSGDFLTLTFPHIAGGNLTYIVEGNDDLNGDWVTAQTYPSFPSAGTTVYTDSVAIGSAPRRMLRLRVVVTD
jgi:autotransporter-associated beta strand protein